MRHALMMMLAAAVLAVTGCARKATVPTPAPSPAWLEPVKRMVKNGDYVDALRKLAESAKGAAQDAGMAEAWYLEGYVLAYGRSEYKKARIPLQKLIDADPRHPMAPYAMRLLGDCYYFGRATEAAKRQYGTLLEMYGDAGFGAYALLQTGNCWIQDGKAGDALTAWRDAVEKYPQDPCAVRAQLQVANVYIGLDDPQMARPELQKLSSMTDDPVVNGIVRAELAKMDAKKKPRSRATKKGTEE